MCGCKQPTDREAYEREHPELAYATPQQEEEEEEFTQEQIEEMIRAAEEEAKAQAEAEERARIEAQAKKQSQSAAHSKQVFEMSRLQLLQALEKDENKDTIIKMVDDGIVQYAIHDEKTTRQWYAICAQLTSDKEGFYPYFKSCLKQRHSKAKDFLLTQAHNELKERQANAATSTPVAAQHTPAPVIPVFKTESEAEKDEEILKALQQVDKDYSTDEDTLLLSNEPEEQKTQGEQEREPQDQKLQDKEPQEQEPQDNKVILWATGFVITFIVGIILANSELSSDFEGLFFRFLPIFTIIGCVGNMVSAGITIKKDVNDNPTLFKYYKSHIIASFALNLLAFLLLTILFFIFNNSYIDGNTLFWFIAVLVLCASLVTHFLMFKLKINIREIALKKKKFIFINGILVILLMILVMNGYWENWIYDVF